MKKSLFLLGCLLWVASNVFSAITITKPSSDTPVYHIAEFVIEMEGQEIANPFTDVQIQGTFTGVDQPPIRVDGFCDSMDGREYRIRFMPSKPGSYTYSIHVTTPGQNQLFEGTLRATSSSSKGLLRVDPERSTHFVWEGTGEHYFWNGTTTYYLMGWQDDAVIEDIVDRLHGYEINRLRVLVYGRNHDRPWGQPVKTTDDFSLYLNPWPAKDGANIDKPRYDLTRFNVAFWQKYERMLRYAREKDCIVSVIFFIGGQVYPTPFEAYSEDELRFYRYGVARLAAFSNVTWDLGNEHNFHREVPKWCDWLGPKVREWDPYDHLLSAHNVIYRTPGKTWNDIQLIQRWDQGQNGFMLNETMKQARTGRLIPNVNEEYGYEDLWEKFPGQRKSDTRRRLAWEISMAGCYQTTGETANRGTGFPPDSGGGWVNGRGDDSMTMLRGYKRMVDFFTALDWWNYEPANERVDRGALCLAKPGSSYIVYFPTSNPVTIQLENGNYRAQWFNPRNGDWKKLAPAAGPLWTSPAPPDPEDWVLLLTHDSTLVDTTPPAVSFIQCNSVGNQIIVTFSEVVEQDSTEEVAHYRMSHNIPVLKATLGNDHKQVVLDIPTLPAEGLYELTIQGVRDQALKPNRLVSEAPISFRFMDIKKPLLELNFEEGRGALTANTGRTREHSKDAVISQPIPRWTKNTPDCGGKFALDFGVEPDAYSIDLGSVPAEDLKGLQSFTITGWINARSKVTGSGGNRILCSVNNGGDGMDLVYLKDGSLQVGINQWPDGSPARSSAQKITFHKEADKANWRFFAVTYDSTAAKDHVCFYFGSESQKAELDRAVSYDRGAVGYDTAALAIGHFNPSIRANAKDRMCRGLLDEIRIFGSQTDGHGALRLDDIQAIQCRKP